LLVRLQPGILKVLWIGSLRRLIFGQFFGRFFGHFGATDRGFAMPKLSVVERALLHFAITTINQQSTIINLLLHSDPSKVLEPVRVNAAQLILDSTKTTAALKAILAKDSEPRKAGAVQ
jgi:hypothetical protein